MAAILAVENLVKSYRLGDEVVWALNDVSLSIEAGQLVAIMGASGSGKSTLLHLTGGLDLPDKGRVIVEGNDLTRMSDRQRTLFRRRRMGIIFQAYNLLPTLSAAENVAVPLLVDGTPPTEIEHRVTQVVKTVHLEHRLHHRPQALSGGEQQRVAIARALSNEPNLILADEPTGNLPTDKGEEILRILEELSSQGVTIIMVTHNDAQGARAHRRIRIQDGLMLQNGALSASASQGGAS